MKSSSKKLFALLILFAAVAMFSMLPVTAAVASTPQTDTTNEGSIQIEAKYKKVSTNKITFNCNGGKIGSKKTVAINIKKGSKIKKFPAIPKRTGFSFKGWYSKKTGGKKISVNTKPAKSTSYYARWTKITSASKIVGNWRYDGLERSIQTGKFYMEVIDYYFFANGKFQCFDMSVNSPEKFEGEYSVSNGKVYLKNMKWYKLSDNHVERNIAKYGADYRKWGWELLRQSSIMTTKYEFGSDKYGSYLKIAYPRADPDPNYIYPGEKFYKV